MKKFGIIWVIICFIMITIGAWNDHVIISELKAENQALMEILESNDSIHVTRIIG